MHGIVQLFTIAALMQLSGGKRNNAEYCGACIALVDEMNWEIDQVDSKSTIQVGSFRIDSRGNQGLREIPLARSELHLTELLEQICNRMNNYGIVEDGSGKINYIRTSSRDQAAITFKTVKISSETQSRLKFACETLLEENEEEILEAFRTSEENIMNHICIETIEICQPHNITEYRAAMDEALSAAIVAEADHMSATSNVPVDGHTLTDDDNSESDDDDDDSDDDVVSQNSNSNRQDL